MCSDLYIDISNCLVSNLTKVFLFFQNCKKKVFEVVIETIVRNSCSVFNLGCPPGWHHVTFALHNIPCRSPIMAQICNCIIIIKIKGCGISQYSGDSNTGHSNYRTLQKSDMSVIGSNIWIPDLVIWIPDRNLDHYLCFPNWCLHWNLINNNLKWALYQ